MADVEQEFSLLVATARRVGKSIIDSANLDANAQAFGLQLLRSAITSIGGYYAATGVPTSVPGGVGGATTSPARCPHCNKSIYISDSP